MPRRCPAMPARVRDAASFLSRRVARHADAAYSLTCRCRQHDVRHMFRRSPRALRLRFPPVTRCLREICPSCRRPHRHFAHDVYAQLFLLRAFIRVYLRHCCCCRHHVRHGNGLPSAAAFSSRDVVYYVTRPRTFENKDIRESLSTAKRYSSVTYCREEAHIQRRARSQSQRSKAHKCRCPGDIKQVAALIIAHFRRSMRLAGGSNREAKKMFRSSAPDYGTSTRITICLSLRDIAPRRRKRVAQIFISRCATPPRRCAMRASARC